MTADYLDKDKNKSGKLVIFTESGDTLSYLRDRLKDETDFNVLSVTAENRKRDFTVIRENFDANFEGSFRHDYDIILTTDVLAEGVNLHRANVIVNYDTPWNPTKLIQRLGRINRIGTEADWIFNYNFYPSEQGDKRINLKQKSLVKLQSSHTTFGEDNQIYSLDEIIDQWELFVEKPDDVDLRSQYLDWLRRFKEKNLDWFRDIEKMPLKIRCIRPAKNFYQKDFGDVSKDISIAFVQNGNHRNIYFYYQNQAMTLPFEKAVKIFEANESEISVLPIPESHYTQINHILKQFESDLIIRQDIGDNSEKMDVRSKVILKQLNLWIADGLESELALDSALALKPVVEYGTYANLTNELYKIRNELNLRTVESELVRLANKYISRVKIKKTLDEPLIEPQIIISETFVN